MFQAMFDDIVPVSAGFSLALLHRQNFRQPWVNGFIAFTRTAVFLANAVVALQFFFIGPNRFVTETLLLFISSVSVGMGIEVAMTMTWDFVHWLRKQSEPAPLPSVGTDDSKRDKAVNVPEK
ncbi:hypothetical protein FA95DRAFT_1678980 [Auriscalpium vulgare]|uniref:Uncharacterized protein n=1 Tax=Auriscalpium vulgare TaxID=40419 RepID=A0ACB8RUR1_9AGAM|nr:hypothetical protein FA95DRAFT_1678980 [Auriscalpium vulgare]